MLFESFFSFIAIKYYEHKKIPQGICEKFMKNPQNSWD